MQDINYYINLQGTAMLASLQQRKELCQSFTKLWCNERPDMLYLVASGTSGNAACAAALFMQQTLGIQTLAITPSSIPHIFAKKPMFVFISQGGHSTNTLRAIAQLKAYPCVTLTGEENCRVNEMCENNIILRCERENAGPKTMGYTCTVLTLYLMALEAAQATNAISTDKYAQAIAKLKSTAEAMNQNVKLVREWYRAKEKAMLKIESYMFVGIGTGQFIAKEAALKVQETVLKPAIGFEFEEYLHGPTSMLHTKPFGMYLLPNKSSLDYARISKVANIHAELGCCVIAVACDEKQAQWEGGKLVLQAPDDEFLTPFWQIIPSQIISASLPLKLEHGLKSKELFIKIDAAVGIKYGGIL